jgi:hypothetical protein
MSQTIQMMTREEMLPAMAHAFPGDGQNLRRLYLLPLVDRLGGKAVTLQEVADAHFLGVNCFEADGHNRNGQLLLTQFRRYLAPILNPGQLNMIAPIFANPGNRLTLFAERKVIMGKLNRVVAPSNACREFFPGALSNKLAGKSLAPGKVTLAYREAVMELRDQPLFPDEMADTDGKRDVSVMYDQNTVTLYCAAVMPDRVLVRQATDCILTTAAAAAIPVAA